MRDFALCVFVGLLAIAPDIAAQEARKLDDYVEGFSRARPILRPASEAPTSTIRQLRFNASPNLVLYAAGDDKIVRRWAVANSPTGGVSLAADTPLTWPIYRAVRGVIYALDVHSGKAGNGDLVAFGGVGTKTSWVNLLKPDQADQAQLLLDPKISQRDNIVNAVGFNPAGTQLAVAHERTGNVLLWNLGASAAQRIDTGLSNVWALSYAPQGDVLVLAGLRAATSKWEVQQWNPSTRAFISNQQAPGPVASLAWGNSTTWIAATTVGVVVQGAAQVNPFGDTRALVGPRNGSHYVLAAFEPSTNTMQVKTWNGNGQPEPLAGAVFVGKDIALDVSPDGRLLAAGGAVEGSDRMPAYSIRIWDLAKRQLLVELPNDGQRQTLGAPIASVGVIPGPIGEGGKQVPYSIGFAWGPPPGRNLPAYQYHFNRITNEVVPYSGGLGREVQTRKLFDARLGTQPVVYLADERNPKSDPWGPLPVWADRRPDCYAVQEQLGLLALGYSDGIVLCDLARLRDPNLKDKDLSIVRSFYGHEGSVTCMSFAPDGSLLLSGAKDGTISGWKIDDLGRSPRQVRNELGVQFARRPNRQGGVALVVQADPPAGSIGAEAGFRAGQVVNKVFVADKPIQPADWEKTLTAPVPGKELIVDVFQPDLGKVIGLLPTPVSHDPLWTLYPQRDLNWSLWTPEGHYLTPPDKSERLAWHLDLNQVVSAAGSLTYEGSMVLFDRNLQELFLNEAIVANAIKNLQPDRPRDSIVAPGLVVDVRGNLATLTAKRNGSQPIAELELWLNGCRLKRLTRTQLTRGKQETLSVEIPPGYLRADGNQLTAVAAVEVVDPVGKGTALVYNRKRTRLPALAAPQSIARKLHYVGVGISKLDGNPTGLSALEYPGHDAVELGRLLRKKLALDAGFFETLADFEGCRPPTEDNIVRLLSELPGRVGPNDLAVVFFAGHGVNTPKGFRVIAKDTTNAAEGRLSDVAINDLLSQLPCRTMLILDTCHAQGAQLQQKLHDWPGFGLGPMILASCDFTKESFEDERLQLPGGLSGHGLFTSALLEGLMLDGTRVENLVKGILPTRDANADGRITIEEWCRYAQQRTAMLSDPATSRFSKPGKDAYTPKVLPSFSFLDHKNFAFAGEKGAE